MEVVKVTLKWRRRRRHW